MQRKERHNYYHGTEGDLIACIPYGSRIDAHPKAPAGHYWEQRAPLGAGYGVWRLRAYPAPAITADEIRTRLESAGLDRGALSRLYVDAIGYCPFADDPAATPANVAETLAGYADEIERAAR